MPSYDHEELKARSIRWLSSRATARGGRAAPEVRLCDQYVADVVAFASLQNRHDKALLTRTFGDVPSYPSRPLQPYLFVFEGKVSQQDFQNTFSYSSEERAYWMRSVHSPEGRYRPRGNFHFCVTTGEFDVDELPRWWGHLTVCGGGLTVDRLPKWCDITPKDELHMHQQVMWKQGNDSIKSLIQAILKKTGDTQ